MDTISERLMLQTHARRDNNSELPAPTFTALVKLMRLSKILITAPINLFDITTH